MYLYNSKRDKKENYSNVSKDILTSLVDLVYERLNIYNINESHEKYLVERIYAKVIYLLMRMVYTKVIN